MSTSTVLNPTCILIYIQLIQFSYVVILWTVYDFL